PCVADCRGRGANHRQGAGDRAHRQAGHGSPAPQPTPSAGTQAGRYQTENTPMRNYLDLLLDVLENGYRQGNRTGIDTLSIPGAMLRFDLAKGFPAVTTKKLAFKAVVGELIGFLRGYDSAADFRRLNCRIWDQNANENGQWLSNHNRKGDDDLGRIYGVQWRWWNGSGVDELDQVMTELNDIRNNSTSRRISINAWRPDEFDQMALPPGHVLYQFIVNTERKELNLCMYQRSADL